MHDSVIAERIIEAARKQGKVRAITIEIGEAAKIQKDELKPTLKAMVDWEIIIDEVKAYSICKCGFQGPPKILERGHDFCLYECPRCGGEPKITEGKEIVLKQVMLEE